MYADGEYAEKDYHLGDLVTCPACGSNVAVGSKFCPAFGTSMTPEAMGRRRSTLIGLLVTAVVLSPFVVVAALQLTGDNKPETPYESCVARGVDIAAESGDFGDGTRAEIREFCRDSYPESAP